jgi:hypothetical protein
VEMLDKKGIELHVIYSFWYNNLQLNWWGGGVKFIV